MIATLSNTSAEPYWSAAIDTAPACPALSADTTCDLAIVGGGFTGLWAALKAREQQPDARIVLIEAGRCGQEASGRTGGFCAPSISHGVSNALARHPGEAETLIRLGRQNLVDYQRDLEDYGIDAGFMLSGKLNVAATPWQVEGLQAMARNYRRFGIECTLLSGAQLSEKLDSPAYTAGLFEPNYALIHPTKTVSELQRVCLAKGVEIFENSAVTGIVRDRAGIVLETRQARVAASRVMLATNAAVPLLKRLRAAFIPIYDYSLVTEPLSQAQWASIGWTGDHGIADSGNQFHYFRKTPDGRMLWAGYDAIYHYGSRRDAALSDPRPRSTDRRNRPEGS